MKFAQYNRLHNDYKLLRREFGASKIREIIEILATKYGHQEEMGREGDGDGEDGRGAISRSVIWSLVSYEFQKESRLSIPKTNFVEIFKTWQENKDTTLLDLSHRYGASPFIIAQKIVNLNYPHEKKVTIKNWLSNTSMIPDPRLAYEVMVCQFNDPIYGTHANHVARNTGICFEQQIALKLKAQGVDYLVEKDLREKEYDVTPDFLLRVPLTLGFAIKDPLPKVTSKILGEKNGKSWFILEREDWRCACNSIVPTDSADEKHTYNEATSRDGNRKLLDNLSTDPSTNNQKINEEDATSFGEFLINWIECKSLFASPECHGEYTASQFSPYLNRFGKGLVIYRHGFVEDNGEIFISDNKGLRRQDVSKSQFLVLNELPKQLSS